MQILKRPNSKETHFNFLEKKNENNPGGIKINKNCAFDKLGTSLKLADQLLAASLSETQSDTVEKRKQTNKIKRCLESEKKSEKSEKIIKRAAETRPPSGR